MATPFESETTEVINNAADIKQQENEHPLSIKSEQEEPTSDVISAEMDPESVTEESLNTEPTELKDYEELPNEMRHHILMYTDLYTINEYGQCSKKCYNEFLKFHLPYRIELRDVDGGIEVNLAYKKPDRVESKKFTSSDGRNPLKRVHRYFIGMYRYFDDYPDEIVVNMKKWPTAIVKMYPIASASDWHVVINKSMYDEFIEWARTRSDNKPTQFSHHLSGLFLKDCDKTEDRVVIGSEFFKSGILTSLWQLDISTKFQMDHADLINCDNLRVWRVTSWTHLEAIRQKVERATYRSRNSKMIIDLPPEDEFKFKMVELFPRGRFHVEYIRHYYKFKIGLDVQGKVLKHGKRLELRICHEPRTSQFLNDSDETDSDEYGEEDWRTDDEDMERARHIEYEEPVEDENGEDEVIDEEEGIENFNENGYEPWEIDYDNDADDERW